SQLLNAPVLLNSAPHYFQSIYCNSREQQRHGARAGVLPAGTAAVFSLSQRDTALFVPFS
ncbi:MAG: hypothetical protein IJ906_05550, partial [Oscillospiraceae bacterium]|nr:hypothetical protein [Oscillospiraceae bacterium]